MFQRVLLLVVKVLKYRVGPALNPLVHVVELTALVKMFGYNRAMLVRVVQVCKS